VIVVSLAGFSYITSGGDPQKTAKAKDTILYALVGVVVAILGATITSFVAGILGDKKIHTKSSCIGANFIRLFIVIGSSSHW